ncbi:MAG: FAD-dependent oxidoreductase [Ktedonobacterales bacterium]
MADDTQHIQTEIAIIGGGLAGASVAYHLAREGYAVTLLERRETLAAEASGRNAGTLWLTGYGRTPDLDETLGMGSRDIFHALQFERGYDLGYRQSGALQVIQTEQEYAYARATVEEHHAQDHRVALLTLREAQSLEPELSPELLGAVYYPLGGAAEPAAITHALAAEAQLHGARILTQHMVTAITCDEDHHYTLTTGQGTVRAGTLVLAAGAESRRVGALLGLNVPVYAVRGQMWSTAPQPRRLFQSIGAVAPACYWNREAVNAEGEQPIPAELTHRAGERRTRHLYGQQLRDGRIILGGDRQLVTDRSNDAQLAPDPEGIATNHTHACEVLPFLGDLPIERTWAGLMPFTATLTPLIGAIPGYPNLYILTGLHSAGFERGAMAGKLLSDAITTGVTPPILAAADPAHQIRAIITSE